MQDLLAVSVDESTQMAENVAGLRCMNSDCFSESSLWVLSQTCMLQQPEARLCYCTTSLERCISIPSQMVWAFVAAKPVPEKNTGVFSENK